MMNDPALFGDYDPKIVEDWFEEIKKELSLEVQKKSVDYGFNFQTDTALSNGRYTWVIDPESSSKNEALPRMSTESTRPSLELSFEDSSFPDKGGFSDKTEQDPKF